MNESGREVLGLAWPWNFLRSHRIASPHQARHRGHDRDPRRTHARTAKPSRAQPSPIQSSTIRFEPYGAVGRAQLITKTFSRCDRIPDAIGSLLLSRRTHPARRSQQANQPRHVSPRVEVEPLGRLGGDCTGRVARLRVRDSRSLSTRPRPWPCPRCPAAQLWKDLASEVPESEPDSFLCVVSGGARRGWVTVAGRVSKVKLRVYGFPPSPSYERRAARTGRRSLTDKLYQHAQKSIDGIRSSCIMHQLRCSDFGERTTSLMGCAGRRVHVSYLSGLACNSR